MLRTARRRHSTCIIQADGRAMQSIILIGGHTENERYSKTTEILLVKDGRFMNVHEGTIQGPPLPVGLEGASCVALPPTSNFACVVIGGRSQEEKSSPHVYGLNRSLKEWTLLGKIRTGRSSHIALPFS